MNSPSDGWSAPRPPSRLVVWHTEGTAASELLSWMWRLKSSLPPKGVELTLVSLEIQPFRFAQTCAVEEIYDARIRTPQEWIAFLKTHRSAVHLINHAYDYVDLVEQLSPALLPRLALAGICHTDQDFDYHHLHRLDSRLAGLCGVSPVCVDKLERLLPHRCGSIPVLPDWDMPLRGRPPVMETEASDPLRVLFNGRMLHLQKRVLDLPAISRHLSELEAPVEFTIVGDGPDLPQLRQEFAHGSHVAHRFLPPCAPWEMAASREQNDVFLQVSEFEGASVSLMEAMAAGLAPVVTKTESGTEMLKHGVNALVSPIGDVATIAENLADLASNRRRVRQLGRNAYETAQACLTRLNYAESLREFVEELQAVSEIQSLKLAL